MVTKYLVKSMTFRHGISFLKTDDFGFDGLWYVIENNILNQLKAPDVSVYIFISLYCQILIGLIKA